MTHRNTTTNSPSPSRLQPLPACRDLATKARGVALISLVLVLLITNGGAG